LGEKQKLNHIIPKPIHLKTRINLDESHPHEMEKKPNLFIETNIRKDQT